MTDVICSLSSHPDTQSYLYGVQQQAFDRKKSSRMCGNCEACTRTEDCAQCDFCKVWSCLFLFFVTFLVAALSFNVVVYLLFRCYLLGDRQGYPACKKHCRNNFQKLLLWKNLTWKNSRKWTGGAKSESLCVGVSCNFILKYWWFVGEKQIAVWLLMWISHSSVVKHGHLVVNYGSDV